MFLSVWGLDRDTGEKLWGLVDQKYEVRGAQRERRRIPHDNKAEALSKTLTLNKRDVELQQSLRDRQIYLSQNVLDKSNVFALDAISISPFSTGLGNEHPLENGFSFLNPYGLPYLPGSGVKGVLRAAASELADGSWGDSHGWTPQAIDLLFGSAGTTEQNGEGKSRGVLTFWDVHPEIKGNSMIVEIMTSHTSHYLQGTETPHDSGKPNPILFAAIPPGSTFSFHLLCDKRLLRALVSNSECEVSDIEKNWHELIRAAFTHAFDWMGFGAKTAVGYGAMTTDPKGANHRADLAEEVENIRQQKIRQDEENASLAAMDDLDREITETLKKVLPAGIEDSTVWYIKAIQSIDWSGRDDDKKEAASRLKVKMRETKGQWRESSTKKNKEKDKEYQHTLLVKKWLSGS